MVLVFVTLAVGESEAVVPFRFVVPTDAFFSAVVCVWTLETLCSWERQVSIIPLYIFPLLLALDHGQRKVQRHASSDVFGCACVDSGILKLGVVYDQLANVGHHDITSHVIGSHDDVVFALQLFLPSDFRLRLSGHFTQKTGGLTHEYGLSGRPTVDGGKLNVSWDGGLLGGSGM